MNRSPQPSTRSKGGLRSQVRGALYHRKSIARPNRLPCYFKQRSHQGKRITHQAAPNMANKKRPKDATRLIQTAHNLRKREAKSCAHACKAMQRDHRSEPAAMQDSLPRQTKTQKMTRPKRKRSDGQPNRIRSNTRSASPETTSAVLVRNRLRRFIMQHFLPLYQRRDQA